MWQYTHCNDLPSEFRKTFKHFYRIRRNSEFCETFFELLKDGKAKKSLTFEKILDRFFFEFNRFEPSFSSKLIATINPKYPIWDKFVLKNLELRPPWHKAIDRIDKIISTYNCLKFKMKEIMISPKGKKWIELFDEVLPNSKITDVKKIDFILWQTRLNKF